MFDVDCFRKNKPFFLFRHIGRTLGDEVLKNKLQFLRK